MDASTARPRGLFHARLLQVNEPACVANVSLVLLDLELVGAQQWLVIEKIDLSFWVSLGIAFDPQAITQRFPGPRAKPEPLVDRNLQLVLELGVQSERCINDLILVHQRSMRRQLTAKCALCGTPQTTAPCRRGFDLAPPC